MLMLETPSRATPQLRFPWAPSIQIEHLHWGIKSAKNAYFGAIWSLRDSLAATTEHRRRACLDWPLKACE